ncbi:MAG TPA: hypothetical protein PK692_01925 [Bacteroidales bacterium]|nr:hypothetical protein [Bacteroidales bacterium]MBP7874725.1 hypothetical protein [Bacteroidales bacterium]MCZ2281536.1 hypothetical protein [Bacteroidales bacterium]HNY59138.1 hypothetical protein [Bacteroidales bacterium]HOG66311.1 hypothetical protein [Bacteroidales bacterium]
MYYKKALSKSDFPLISFETDNLTNLLSKKVRLSNHNWSINRTFNTKEVG